MYHDVWQEMLAVRTALRYAQNQLTMDYSVPYLANPNALSAARARIANIPGLTLTLVQRAKGAKMKVRIALYKYM